MVDTWCLFSSRNIHSFGRWNQGGINILLLVFSSCRFLPLACCGFVWVVHWEKVYRVYGLMSLLGRYFYYQNYSMPVGFIKFERHLISCVMIEVFSFPFVLVHWWSLVFSRSLVLLAVRKVNILDIVTYRIDIPKFIIHWMQIPAAIAIFLSTLPIETLLFPSTVIDMLDYSIKCEW
jgi:hypothetical protein